MEVLCVTLVYVLLQDWDRLDRQVALRSSHLHVGVETVLIVFPPPTPWVSRIAPDLS